MKISVQVAVFSEGWQPPKETVVPEGNPEKALQEVVDWFRTQLKEALAHREDVEVLVGRKPEGTVGELEEEAAEDVFGPRSIFRGLAEEPRFVSRRQPGTPRPDYQEGELPPHLKEILGRKGSFLIEAERDLVM